MIGGRLMFMSFPPIVSEWVALGSLASSSVGLTHCPGRCGVFAGVFLAPNPVKIGEIWSFFGSPIQEMMRLAIEVKLVGNKRLGSHWGSPRLWYLGYRYPCPQYVYVCHT